MAKGLYLILTYIVIIRFLGGAFAEAVALNALRIDPKALETLI